MAWNKDCTVNFKCGSLKNVFNEHNNCVYLWNAMWCFDVCVYSGMTKPRQLAYLALPLLTISFVLRMSKILAILKHTLLTLLIKTKPGIER